jgi:hypothetical protein
MQPAISSFVTSQLISSLPMFLVYFGAGIAALIFFRRSPLAAGLVLFGVGLLALITIVSIAFQASVIHAHTSGVKPPSSQVSSALYLVFACLRSIATALLVAAAFVDRRESAPGNPFLKS